jgi:acetate---CoA ligase (ADP-forming)
MLKSPKIDGVLAVALNPDSPLHRDIDPVRLVAAARQEAGSRKPIAIWIYGSGIPTAVDRLEAIDSVACFGSIEQAVQGLSFCYRYHKIKRRKFPEPRTFAYKSKSAKILLQKGRKQRALSDQDALALLSAFGIPVVRRKSVRKWDELEKAAEALDYPLVLKLSGEAFLRKSEWGGVATGIRNKKELREAFKRMKENVSRRDPNVRMGFQLQEQAKGKELLLGLKRDPNFGLVLVCGFGGIYTEVFKDISRELVPIGRWEAERVLWSLKTYPLLKGVRGEAGVEWKRLLDALERLSFLATKIPDIAELDINPLMANASGCKAVDARMLW